MRLHSPPRSSCTARAPEREGGLVPVGYGCDAQEVSALCNERSEWTQPIHPALPYRAGEAIWAARHEAAPLYRRRARTAHPALFLDARASIAAAPKVAALLVRELHRDAAWQDRQATEFRNLAASYLPEI